MDVIAHRGASADAPEHTIAAYELALAHGADYIELDVRATADGTLVILHDPTLERTAGDPREIIHVRDSELAALPASVRPLRLDETLATYGALVSFWIEVKDLRPARPEALLAALAGHTLVGPTRIGSFDTTLLRRLRRLDPSLSLVALVPPLEPAEIRPRLDRLARIAGGLGLCCTSVDAELVLAARARGLRVEVHTVNEELEMERLLALGVDGLVTDVPARAHGVLSAQRIAA